VSKAARPVTTLAPQLASVVVEAGQAATRPMVRGSAESAEVVADIDARHPAHRIAAVLGERSLVPFSGSPRAWKWTAYARPDLASLGDVVASTVR